MTSPTAESAYRLRFSDVRVVRSVLFLTAGLLVGVVTIVILSATFAITVGVVPTVVLVIPAALGSLAASRALANVQRSRAVALLGARMDAPAPSPETDGGLWTRVKGYVGHRALWREYGYHHASWLLNIVSGTLVAGAVVVGLMFTTVFAWADLSEASGGWSVSTAVRIVFTCVGPIILVVSSFLARGLAYGDYLLMHALLDRDRSEVLQARVRSLTETRAGAVDSAMSERRRLERDLHDGTQQRLTSLAMNLGIAKAQFKDLPDDARKAIDDAHREAKETLTELRGLVRGLHPAVLDDRGLDAALSGIVARSPIPATLHTDLPERASRTAESIAYFVVSEAMTNAARHSGATQIDVTARSDRRHLTIQVSDNGGGGVDPSRGTGLAGLRQRVEAVDGRLILDSPRGGPTVLTVELPCAL